MALIKYNVMATEELTRVGPSESSPLYFTAAIRADTASRARDAPSRQGGPPQALGTLDVYDNAYYVEVELTKRDSTGNPGVMRIGLAHETS